MENLDNLHLVKEMNKLIVDNFANNPSIYLSRTCIYHALKDDVDVCSSKFINSINVLSWLGVYRYFYEKRPGAGFTRRIYRMLTVNIEPLPTHILIYDFERHCYEFAKIPYNCKPWGDISNIHNELKLNITPF